MNRIQLRFVEEAVSHFSKLDSWHQKFIDNLVNNYENKDLSPAQNRELNKIHNYLYSNHVKSQLPKKSSIRLGTHVSQVDENQPRDIFDLVRVEDCFDDYSN